MKLDSKKDTALEYEIEITEESLQEILKKVSMARSKMLPGQAAKIHIGELAGANVAFILRPEIPLFGTQADGLRSSPIGIKV